MMALSTTIFLLLLNGFFQKLGIDLFATWMVVALSAASGALAVALIKFNLPDIRKVVAITYIALLFIILLGSYLTSFFGYSEAYVLYFIHPQKIGTDFSFAQFMTILGRVWLGVAITSVICTAAYLIIQLTTPKKLTGYVETQFDDTDALAE